MEAKVVFIHGRPGAHQMHQKFATSVGAEFCFVDFKMRWQDKSRSIFYRVMSWVVCAITFPNIKKHTIFFVDNLHFMPVVMKMLRLNKKKQKIVAHLGSHTLYFIYAHRFSKLTERLHIWALSNYDALICEGQMAEDLVKKILGEKTPPLYTVINGIPQDHFPTKTHNAKLNTNTILFAGHGPGKERLWYKGLDLMLQAFNIAKRTNKDLEFVIVGEWEKEIQKELLNGFNEDTVNAIKFVGPVKSMEHYFTEASLYLHCARGEAYGLTVLIAMAYGLPVIVSEWTGTKEIVKQVDETYIIELNAEKIANRIIKYFNLSILERQKIGEKSKLVGTMYTEERAIQDFRDKFNIMINDFKLN